MRHGEKHKLFNHNTGVNHHKAKLSEQNVLDIRKKYIKGIYGYQKLGNEYGVSKIAIAHIINRKLWKHI